MILVYVMEVVSELQYISSPSLFTFTSLLSSLMAVLSLNAAALAKAVDEQGTFCLISSKLHSPQFLTISKQAADPTAKQAYNLGSLSKQFSYPHLSHVLPHISLSTTYSLISHTKVD